LLHAEIMYAMQKQHVFVKTQSEWSQSYTSQCCMADTEHAVSRKIRAHPISIGPINLRGIGIQGDGSRHERGVIRRIRRLPDQSRCSQSRSHGGCQIGSPHIIPCKVVGPVKGVVLRPAPVVLVGGVVTHLHAFIHTFSTCVPLECYMYKLSSFYLSFDSQNTSSDVIRLGKHLSDSNR